MVSTSPATGTGTTAGPGGAPRAGELIARLRDEENRPALVGYLPVGFPDVERSIEALLTLTDNGVDVIELGIPYSDPVMDGLVIQEAAQAALDGGVRVTHVFEAMRRIREHAPHVAVLPMTYWNPVLRYGVEEFARDLVAAGGSGLITPDLIPDEAGAWIAASDELGLDRVFLVAPSSTPERLALTARASRGFVYATSLMGVTGVRASVGERAEQLVADTRAAGAEHVCVGIGVSTGAQSAEVGRWADGVIVGSALVRTLLGDAPWDARLSDLAELTRDLASGVRSARAAHGAH
ncbi:tryptophan synthase subunit alpha [Myceligenerans pegani]|uniref:Tryptophan synthase alpha chain n=1 Tax=Myceligenerans pegani TaxID=2776917 RepID=A0ABR9MZS5_9MICO|nr:tryptophan synthase subunit alpha [Myceligenerans sp. TRM 65318]MBE1876903.1 tryptophan synthase subunit alpha [Myceligenerans sp. TRM 65318]MBE3019174.1 tryptophan synthase subunit alpha [Myceligenerans sp. TRM 65318]